MHFLSFGLLVEDTTDQHLKHVFQNRQTFFGCLLFSQKLFFLITGLHLHYIDCKAFLTILYRASTSRSVYRSTGTLFQRLKEVQRNLDFAINFLCVIMNFLFLALSFMLFVVFMIMLNILLNLPPYISLRNQDESRNLNYHPQLNVKLRKLLERRKSQRMK